MHLSRKNYIDKYSGQVKEKLENILHVLYVEKKLVGIYFGTIS